MKKVLIKSKGILISLMIVTLVITVSSIGITYSKYKAKTNVNVVSNTGKLVCDVSVDSKDEYIEDNERYFYINVKNSNKDSESDTDIGYVLTIENEDNSKGLYRYIDSYGNSNDDYVEKLEIKEHILNNYNKEERFKIRVKSESAVKTEIKYKVKINCYQKENTGIVNPYKEGTLAYNIFENALNPKDDNRTKLNLEKVEYNTTLLENEKTLRKDTDDYGITYYYRGNVEDNYLTLGGMCFRIVRIEGDGSVKLILEDKLGPCGENTVTNPSGENALIGKARYGIKMKIEQEITKYIENYIESTDGARVEMMKWLGETSINQDLLKKEKFCLGYDGNELPITTKDKFTIAKDKAYGDILNFNHNGEKCDTNKIGLLNIEEVRYAGGRYSYFDNTNTYNLLDIIEVNYKYSAAETLTYRFGVYTHENSVQMTAINYDCDYNRPVIVLNKNIKIKSGNGTKENAYIIE